MKWIVTGQIFLADGFDWEIEADTEEQARYLATARAHDVSWPEAETQEVCINGSQKIEDKAEPAGDAPISLADVKSMLDVLVAEGKVRVVDGKYSIVEKED